MDLVLLFPLVVYSLVLAFICAGIWKSKGGSEDAGFVLGFILGIFGLAYVAFANPTSRASVREYDRWVPREGDEALVRVGIPAAGLKQGDPVKILELKGPDAKVETSDGRQRWIEMRKLTPIETPLSATKVCPMCAESVKEQARVCRYCGYMFLDSEGGSSGT